MNKDRFRIMDFVYPNGIVLDTDNMIRYAKKNLQINKKVHGLDKEIKSKDLNDPINAWAYLRNLGIGLESYRG